MELRTDRSMPGGDYGNSDGIGEHLPIAYVDRETSLYQSEEWSLPDPFAREAGLLARFATAVLPSIPRPRLSQTIDSIANIAKRLKRLELRYKNIVLLCFLPQWPWIREAYQQSEEPELEVETVYDPQVLGVDRRVSPFYLENYLSSRPREEG